MKFYSSILFKLIASVFIVELVIMVVLRHVIPYMGENAYLDVIMDATVLSLFMAGAFYLYLKRPLNKIFSVVGAVKNGQFHVRTGIEGEDEISRLAMYIDEMLVAFQRIRDKELVFNEELRAMNENLQSSTDSLKTAIAEQEAVNAELEETKAEAEKRYVELERTHKIMMGREKRVIELKEENEKLKEELKKCHES